MTPNKIEGDWEFQNGYYQISWPGYPVTTAWTQENGIRYDGADTIRYYQYTYSFNKNGTYEIVYERDLPDTVNLHYIDITKGNWQIMGADKIHGFKDGTRILLTNTRGIRINKHMITGQSDTTDDNVFSSYRMWHVEKITNKEMVWKIDHERVETTAPQDSHHRTIRMEFEKH